MSLAEELPRRWWRDPAELVEEVDGGILLGDVLYARPEWHARALCRGQMEDGRSPWFAESTAERRAAREVCMACPVRLECEAAREPYGVWGGR